MKKHKVGFTGTRKGITDHQRSVLTHALLVLRPAEFHHGDCDGADDESANLVHKLRSSRGWQTEIVVHPPKDGRFRSHNLYFDIVLPVKPYLTRNRDIVDDTDILIACPLETSHQSRGGTWFTFDYATKKGKPTLLIYPGGETECTNYEKLL